VAARVAAAAKPGKPQTQRFSRAWTHSPSKPGAPAIPKSPEPTSNVDNVPDFVYESTEKSQADEITRYGSAFKDPRNKVNHLEIITNDEKAGAYYDAMLAAKGVPGRTRIVP
jgi:hypothetical protein